MAERPNNQLYNDIAELKTSMAAVDVLVQRVDKTLEKLTEVSQNVSEVLAVQGNRIDFQEKMLAALSTLTNKVRDDAVATEKYLTEKMDHKIKELQNEIQSLHKFIWLVSGGAVVIGFFLNKLSPVVLKLFA